jgi:hypothetical protein
MLNIYKTIRSQILNIKHSKEAKQKEANQSEKEEKNAD